MNFNKTKVVTHFIGKIIVIFIGKFMFSLRASPYIFSNVVNRRGGKLLNSKWTKTIWKTNLDEVISHTIYYSS